MRTIAGQIQQYLFPNLNILTSFESTFLSEWKDQLGGAAVEATNIAGDEHFGATFGATAPLPALAANLPLPPNATMVVHYAVDDLIATISFHWLILNAFGNRVRTDNLDPAYRQFGVQPDAKGPYKLASLSISGQGTTLRSFIKGKYLTGHGMPDVPFTLTFSEQLAATGTVPNAPSLTYGAPDPIVDADPDALEKAIDALKAVTLGLPLGLEAIPLLIYGSGRIAEALADDIKPVRGALSILKPVYDKVPQRFHHPDGKTNIVFRYDSVTLPQGPIAASSTANEVIAATPGSVIVLAGANPPVRAPRIAYVGIEGLHAITLHALSGPHANVVVPAQALFSAAWNDEVENPTFIWSLKPPAGTPPGAVALKNATSAQVEIVFNANNVRAPAGTYTLSVLMDDALHLKDAGGHQPAAHVALTVSYVAIAPPVPHGGGLLTPMT